MAPVLYCLLSRTPPVPSASVKVRLRRNELVAKATINGHLMTVLLDTGAAPSIIDRSLCRKFGFKVAGQGADGSGGGTNNQKAYTVANPRLRLGSLSVPSFEALATDLTGLSKKFGTRIDAVLGDSVFSGCVVQFDYRRKMVRFYPKLPHLPQNSVTLPFTHDESEIHIVGMKVNGQPVDANLDTGANSFCSLTPRGIDKLNLRDQVARAPKGESTGFNGTYARRSGKLESIAFGSFVTLAPPATFWETGTGHDDRNWDINLGNRYLKHFTVTVDYNRKTVTFSKPIKRR